MPLVINTNISSLDAQRNLEASGSDLSTALQRLSSGLRINSARDDAAGLSISVRFTSQIQGLTQASRNANDAISLSQVAEGALQQVTEILQRSRELAVQSANGTNSASDRAALQAEVNQLQQELSRISNTTTFNEIDVLNGDLQNQTFQVGAEANQTISVSIQDCGATNLGTNLVTNDNDKGLGSATFATFEQTSGDQIGVVQSSATLSTNGYGAVGLVLSHTSSSGAVTTSPYTTVANNSAAATAAAMLTNFTTGLESAVGYNEVTVGTFAGFTADDTVVLNGQTIATAAGATISVDTLAAAINSNTTLQGDGIYAVSNGSTMQVISTTGLDLSFDCTGGAHTGTFSATGLDGTTATTVADKISTWGGRVDLVLNEGYSIAETTTNHILSASETLTKVGNTAFNGNNVGAQTLTIVGSTGATTVSVAANVSASSITTSVNAVSGSTGVTATAITTATLSGLSQDGTVTFNLFGSNTVGAAISATVTTTDLTALMTAINNSSGTTGITAALGTSNAQLVLTDSNGDDIKISDFTHSAAVGLQDPGTTAVSGTGSSVVAPNQVSFSVTGENGSSMNLLDGGEVEGLNFTVVGGIVSFNSSSAFNVSSSIDGAGATGQSLFSGTAGSANTSTLSNYGQVDISTQAGAESAISVIDGALDQISSVRAVLGAVQNRFTLTIANLENAVENLSAARSRILDADFAEETANLTRAQILQQAGIAILSQANQIPENVLSLLPR